MGHVVPLADQGSGGVVYAYSHAYSEEDNYGTSMTVSFTGCHIAYNYAVSRRQPIRGGAC